MVVWKPDWRKSLYGQTCPVFKWLPSHMALPFEYQTPILSNIKMNLVFMCLVFRWLLYLLLKMNLRCPDTDTGGIVLTSRVVPTVPTIWAPPSSVEAIMGRLLATNVAELPDPAACNVISPEPEGVGEPSRLSDSGVIRPDIPTWLGDEGALRLEREKNKI